MTPGVPSSLDMEKVSERIDPYGSDAVDAGRTDSEPIHVPARWRIKSKERSRFFYKVFLPLGVVANLALGIVILTGLQYTHWYEWLQVGTGAFCCMVAGWLAAAVWSKSYWNRNMARQVTLWRQIADTFFAWLEDAPLPAEAIHRLKSSLDQVVPTTAEHANGSGPSSAAAGSAHEA